MGSDLLPLIVRVAVSLVAVLGLVWLLSRAARRRMGGRAVDASRFTVVARQSLSRSAGVTVLRLGDEALVVGVTDASVQLLARMPLDSITGTSTEVTSEVVSVREVARDLAEEPVSDTPASPALRFTPASSPRRATATVAVTGVPQQRAALAGSALSPATWTSALEVLRERTTRR